MLTRALRLARVVDARLQRGPRVHVVIRLDPSCERSHVLGAYSSLEQSKYEIERVDAVGGWNQLPTNPFWVTEPTSTNCFWEILELDVDWSLIDVGLDRSHGRPRLAEWMFSWLGRRGAMGSLSHPTPAGSVFFPPISLP
jgi:hypothetical protein